MGVGREKSAHHIKKKENKQKQRVRLKRYSKKTSISHYALMKARANIRTEDILNYINTVIH